MPIFVETFIRVPIDELWRATQEPALHQQWDLRFSEITYLPKEGDDAPQMFRYRTRIGAGLAIDGEGESTGEQSAENGSRVSALRFWSSDPKSLIREGSGFWKYEPSGEAIRFYTIYDYRTRFGAAGRVFDGVLFRPLMAWATAWSFDRLRLWLEDSIPPAVALRTASVQTLARVTLAILWIYQGLVPKLLMAASGELALAAVTVGPSLARLAVIAAGVAEIAVGASLLLMRRSRGLIWFSAVFVSMLTITGISRTPQIATAPFNAVTLTLAMLVLGAIVLLTMDGIPSASHARWSARRALP